MWPKVSSTEGLILLNQASSLMASCTVHCLRLHAAKVRGVTQYLLLQWQEGMVEEVDADEELLVLKHLKLEQYFGSDNCSLLDAML